MQAAADRGFVPVAPGIIRDKLTVRELKKFAQDTATSFRRTPESRMPLIHVVSCSGHRLAPV
jgi:hypothetical protein